MKVECGQLPTRIFVFDFGVRCAHTDSGFEVALLLTYLPMCAAEKNCNHAEG